MRKGLVCNSFDFTLCSDGNVFIFLFFVFILFLFYFIFILFFIKQKLKIYLRSPIFKIFKNKNIFVFTFFKTILKKMVEVEVVEKNWRKYFWRKQNKNNFFLFSLFSKIVVVIFLVFIYK